MSDPKALQKKIFDLTLALYRVTDFFPRDEALRRQLREKGNEIFSLVGEFNFSRNPVGDLVGVISKLQVMKGYLELAQSLNFVRPINSAILSREYSFFEGFFTAKLTASIGANQDTSGRKEKTTGAQIGQELEELPTWSEFATEKVVPKSAKVAASEVKSLANDLNERQRKILEHLRALKTAKISDFFSVFSDISSKTIQRDLQDLVEKKMLNKEGEKRWTIYTLK